MSAVTEEKNNVCLSICDVTGQNQALVAICHLPQMQF